MARREFTRAVRVAIVKRATRNGQVYCEGCGLPAKRWEVDHTDPDAMQIDKSRKLTADEGKVLCKGSPECCHDRKSAVDVATIAKAKRVEAKHHGLRKQVRPAAQIRSAPMPTTAKAAKRAASGHKPPVPRKREIYA